MSSTLALCAGLVGGFMLMFFKIYKKMRLSRLSNTYFADKTVLITGASSGLGKSNIQGYHE
jgi:hypothetical protein